MVGFHVAALLRAAPSAAQSLCLLQTCARIAARHLEDAEDDPAGSYTDSEALVADLVLHTARGAAGKDAVEEAAQLHIPKSAPLATPATCFVATLWPGVASAGLRALPMLEDCRSGSLRVCALISTPS